MNEFHLEKEVSLPNPQGVNMKEKAEAMKSAVKTQSMLDYKNTSGCIVTYGHFSIIHAGHIRYLKHARTMGEKLIVAVLGDERKYAFKQDERAEGVALLGIADEVVLLEERGLEKFLSQARPSVLVLGNEYKRNASMNALSEWLDKKGIRVEYHAGETQNTAVDLLEGGETEAGDKKLSWIRELCEQKGITRESVEREVKQWSNVKILVIGDLIIDEYSACEALGMSAEAPVIVVKELKTRRFLGGAGVVAAHIKALGAECRFISVAGEDAVGDYADRELSTMGIEARLIRDNRRPTTLKKRYVADNQKLLRVSRLEDNEVCDSIEKRLIDEIQGSVGQVDGVVISDFVYGIVTQKIIDTVREVAEANKIPIFADVQCSTQVGSICKYEGFTVLTPNEREARLALQDQNSGIEQLAMDLMDATRCGKLFMKLGSEGFISYERGVMGEEISRMSFPALSTNPIDVAGAGDSLLSVVATGLSAGAETAEVGMLACCMAAIAVERMGNDPIRSAELIAKVRSILKD